MKKRTILYFSLLFLGLNVVACNNAPKQNDTKEKINTPVKGGDEVNVVLKDYGAEPTVLNIDAYTTTNDDFRVVLWTGKNLQVTLMSIPVGGDVGLELHPDVDQFLRIEEGEGKVLMGDSQDALTFTQTASADFAIFVPAGKWHNLINTGDTPLKIYSIYSPPEHPHGTIHKTQQEADHNH